MRIATRTVGDGGAGIAPGVNPVAPEFRYPHKLAGCTTYSGVQNH
jgi:hypothetical protein